MLLPALANAKNAAKRTACISNLRQIGVALQVYAGDHDGRLPFGPQAPPFTSPASLYPSTGAPTSLLSLQTGEPAALGLLLDRWLANQPRVVFCPGSDQTMDATAELARVGEQQAQGSYYYRHAGNTELFDDPTHLATLRVPTLDALGDNRLGFPIRVLVMDSHFLCPPELAAFNVKPRTHHQRKTSNLLLADASVRSEPNRDDQYTVNVEDYAQLRNTFSRILEAFERADAAY
jgi:hypothetical protein